MTAADALAALREHWDNVIAELGPAAAGELMSLVSQLDGPGRDAAVGQIVSLLAGGLPARHPVRRALVKGDLFAPSAINWGELAALRDRAARPSASSGAPGAPAGDLPPSVAEILQVVTGRLLAAPALSEQQVRQRGADPADPGLIRLTRADGGDQWPLFQFKPGAGPLPVVLTINILLNAATDPVGVADWWLSRNGWLEGRPSDLLGRVPDEALLSAARAVGSEV